MEERHFSLVIRLENPFLEVILKFSRLNAAISIIFNFTKIIGYIFNKFKRKYTLGNFYF